MTPLRYQAGEPEFGSLEVFVADYLAHVYARQVIDIQAVVWCPQWWRHPEAVARLAALHARYELARHDGPAAMSDWWLLHADPHMNRLLDPSGPFKYCSLRNGHNDHIKPLPVTPAPDHLGWGAA